MSKKERKAWIESQLPLKEGRPVAFRPPKKKGEQAEAGATEFIQGKVVGVVSGDAKAVGDKAKWVHFHLD